MRVRSRKSRDQVYGSSEEGEKSPGWLVMSLAWRYFFWLVEASDFRLQNGCRSTQSRRGPTRNELLLLLPLFSWLCPLPVRLC